MTPCRTGRQALTLPETLVVTGVLGVLAGLILPAVQRVRGAAAKVACANNLKQVGLACQNFESATGRMPPAIGRAVTPRPAAVGLPWTVTLLPFVEQDVLYGEVLAAYRSTWRTYLDPPHAHLATVIKLYACPADGRLATPLTDDLGYSAAYKSYVAVAGGQRTDGVMRSFADSIRLAEVTDGASGTLLVAERPPLGKYFGGVWYSALSTPVHTASTLDAASANTSLPARRSSSALNNCRGPFRYGPGRLSNDCDYFHYWSLHGGGANFLFCDGSVRFLLYSAEPVMVPMATRAGGEVVEVP